MTKMVSFRLDQQLVSQFDKFIDRDGLLNRSEMFRRLLEAFLKCTSEKDMWKILSTHDPYGDGVLIMIGFKNK